MLSASRLHNLAAFSMLCTHAENSAWLVLSNVCMEFSVDCCSSCNCKPITWLCNETINSDMFKGCILFVLCGMLPLF